MHARKSRVKLCAVRLRNAILGNDLNGQTKVETIVLTASQFTQCLVFNET